MPTEHKPSSTNGVAAGSFSLPPTLFEDVLRQFDDLVSQGLVFFDDPAASEFHTASGFNLELRVNPSFRNKPSLPRSAALSSANPFLNPEPRLVVLDSLGPPGIDPKDPRGDRANSERWLNQDGPSAVSTPAILGPPSFDESGGDDPHPAKYRLIMNKFSVYRPQVLVTTRAFASQADDLDADDLETCWAVMGGLATAGRRYMMIYNAGKHSGNSQPHKHMQVFPAPRRDEHAFYFGGGGRERTRGGVRMWTAAGAPFWHVAARVPPPQGAVREGLWRVYAQLLAEARAQLARAGVEGPASYNVAMTEEVMVLVPRRRAGGDGLMLNAASMAGLVWLSRELDRERWTPARLDAHFESCGLPRAEAEAD